MSEKDDRGRLQQTYYTSWSKNSGLIALSIFGLVAGALLICGMAVDSKPLVTWSAWDVLASLFVLVCGVQFVLWCGAELVRCWRESARVVALYERGIQIHDADEGYWLPFSAVTEYRDETKLIYRNKVLIATNHEFRLRDTSGRELALRHLIDADTLGAALAERTLDALISPALAAISSGKPYAIGPVTLTRTGVIYRDATVPWRELSQLVQTERGFRIATRTGRLDHVLLTVEAVPNLHLLEALIKASSADGMPVSAAQS